MRRLGLSYQRRLSAGRISAVAAQRYSQNAIMLRKYLTQALALVLAYVFSSDLGCLQQLSLGSAH